MTQQIDTERLKQIRRWRSGLTTVLVRDKEWLDTIDFLLSLFGSDSQAAGERRLTCAKCGQKRAASTLASDSNFLCRFCFSTEYVTDGQDKDAVARITEQLFSGLGMPSLKERAGNLFLNALIATRSDAVTAMRDRCKIHLQATADALDVRQETECPSGTAFNSEAALRRRIADELSSLTLDTVNEDVRSGTPIC